MNTRARVFTALHAMRRVRAAESARTPVHGDAKRIKSSTPNACDAPLTPHTPAARTPQNHDGDRLFNSPPPTVRRRGADGQGDAKDRAHGSGASESPASTPMGFTRRFLATALSRAFGSNLKTPSPGASDTEQQAVSEASALRESLREERIRVEELCVRAGEAEASLAIANTNLDGLRARVARAEDEAKAALALAAVQASPSMMVRAQPECERSQAAMRLIASYFASRRCDSCGLDELLASAREADLDVDDVLRALALLAVDTPSRSSSFMVTIHQI
jgi:hypothetical protein